MRTPERRTLTGCRWRMSEPRTARTRLRLVFGMPTRKTDFQICELTMPSCSFRRFAILSPVIWFRGYAVAGFRGDHPQPRNPGASQPSASCFQERVGVRPLPALLMELYGFIDDDLAIRRVDVDLGPLERTRRRTFEVDAGPVIAAAVARAFELVLRREPVRRASEMRADGDEGVHALFRPDDPDAVLVLPALVDFADRIIGGRTGLEFLDRLEEDVGEKEAAEDAGEAAEGGGEGRPGDGQNPWK